MTLNTKTWHDGPTGGTPLDADALNDLEARIAAAVGSAGGAVASVAGKTGVVALVKADVGLGSVDNTSDVNKPVSTAQAAAISAAITALLNGAPGALDTLNELATALGDDANFATTVTNALATKAPLASPALTGTPTAPTAALGTNTTQLATAAFVAAAIAALINSAPGALDTLGELAAAMTADEGTAATLATLVGTKAPLASPTFTGTPAAPTVAGTTDSTTKVATTAFVQAVAALLAPLASPTFTGDPKAPTPTSTDNDTSIATTAFVKTAIAGSSIYNVSPSGGDDTSAIQAAMTAIPSTGGIIRFAPGDYQISAPLVPKSYTQLIGTHNPQYTGSVNPPSSCKLRAIGTWTAGRGMLEPALGFRAIHLEKLALVGNAIGQRGLLFPASSAGTGEVSLSMRDVTIAGFKQSAFYGTLAVGRLDNIFVHNNEGYGIEVAPGSGDRWNDVFVNTAYFFYNRKGGAYFGGATSAYVYWLNCRFERSGQTFGNPENNGPDSNWNADAAGIRMERAQFFGFTNCNTDANTGPGFDVYGREAGNSAWLSNIYFTTCFANRDGGGAQGTLSTTSSGFRILGFNSTDGNVPKQISFVNCDVGVGGSNDAGVTSGKPIGPAYGLYYSNTFQNSWSGRQPGGATGPFLAAGTCYGTGITYTDLGGSLKYIKAENYTTPTTLVS